jgi:hypothetical protein
MINLTTPAQAERIAAHRHARHPYWWHGMAILCCRCRRQRVNGRWIYAPVPISIGKISHGLCPACGKKEIEKAHEEIEQIRKEKEENETIN